MPAKEEEVKKYRDAAIGKLQWKNKTHHWTTLTIIPNQSAAGRGKFKEATTHVYSTSRDVVVFSFLPYC